MELEEIKNEVFRGIGRNVMLFQQMEHMLKLLLANGQHSGYSSELVKNIGQRREAISNQTMGQVVGQYLENTFSAYENTSNKPEELKDVWFSYRFVIEGSDDFYQERKNALRSIVTKRNDLIHHLLPKWDFNSIESSIMTAQFLDQQRETILPEIEILRSQIKAMQQAIKEHADFLASDEFKTQLELSLLRQSRLVEWLIHIAKQRVRPDGWVELSSTAHFIRHQIPEDVVNLENRYGFKKLKEAILATEYFDITEEKTEKGGCRVLYRIKPDLNFVE